MDVESDSIFARKLLRHRFELAHATNLILQHRPPHNGCKKLETNKVYREEQKPRVQLGIERHDPCKYLCLQLDPA